MKRRWIHLFIITFSAFALICLSTPVNAGTISGGGKHSLAVKPDSTVAVWGDFVQCAYLPPGLSGVVSVSAGYWHSLALKSDGTVAAWGENAQNQCSIPPGLSGVVCAEAGALHSLALKNDGTIVAWGANTQNQCSIPPGLSGIVAVSAGDYHNLALKQDGTVVAWGYNGNGQCNVPPGLTEVVAVAAGETFSAALQSDGSVITWGTHISDPGSGSPPSTGVVAISAGGMHALALLSDGTVHGWGKDMMAGQITPPPGLSGVVAISAGTHHSLALRSDGTVVAWGYNGYGQCNVPADLIAAVPVTNNAPVLSSIGSRSSMEGQPLTFTISASDFDGDNLAFTASNLPSGATFDPATGTFSWTPGYGQSGSYQDILFTVTDNGTPPMSDSESITITVGNVNRPPVLQSVGNKTASENQFITFAVSAIDPDEDSLTYSAANLPTGAIFDPQTGIFSWTPTYSQAGNYPNVLFTVTDSGYPVMSASESITITVGNVNRPPQLAAIGNKTIDENNTLQFTVTATDPDNDALTYAASNLPVGAVFDPLTQTFSWIPTFEDTGNYIVYFTVRDNGDPSLIASESITISVNNVNRPPRLQAIGDRVVMEGELLEFVVTATDPDGDLLAYTAVNLPPGAGFYQATRTFTWTPNFDQAGLYPNVEFAVSDNGNPVQVDVKLISITVGNGNRPPVFTPIGPQQTAENSLLEFTLMASDPDGQNLTYSAQSLPAGAGFNPATRAFSWVPDSAQTGNYTVVFTACDNDPQAPLTATLEVSITVSDISALDEARLIISIMDGLSLSGREYANVKKVPTFISDGKITPALNQLDAFIKKLETDISKGWINPTEGNRLILMARDLITHLKPRP